MPPARWSYSFRSTDFSGPDRRERKGRRAPVLEVPADATDGQHECRRDPAWLCAGYRFEQHEDGTFTRHPGLTPRPFCEACERKLSAALGELPGDYERLAEAVGERPVLATGSRSAFGPRTEYRDDVDALMGEISAALGMWAERVRPVARLSVPQYPPGTPERVAEDAGVLARNLSVLMARQSEKRPRTYQLRPTRRGDGELSPELEALIGDDEFVRAGVDFVTVRTSRDSDGAAAGNEILNLQYRVKRILGETAPPRESIDGVPCRECEAFTLERAEPPSDPKVKPARSKCSNPACGDVMDDDEFAQWAKRYAAWAEGAGLPACRKCQRGDHGDCRWAACPCRSSGHAAA